MRVAVIMGSTSDLPKVEPAIKILKDYGVQVDVRCLSAHRAHAGLSAFIEEANGNGTEVFITAAGMSAALPVVVASQTVLPDRKSTRLNSSHIEESRMPSSA